MFRGGRQLATVAECRTLGEADFEARAALAEALRSGEALAVSGDFSTLRTSPLGEAHRDLERIADP